MAEEVSAFDWLLDVILQQSQQLTGRELQPCTDLIDGGGATEAEEEEAEHTGPHCP